VRFLIDNQLPAALTVWLREQGEEAEHVLEVGLAQEKDNPVWRHATEKGAAIISKDEGFAEWVRRGRAGPAVVWLRVGNCSKRSLMTWLAPLWPKVLRELQRGSRLIEVR